ncbi:hypothetical protein [Labilibacter marinus]|uniref:hypothetical protein n=1 Tax=Labilibacter marinus TaxID=1477105 RepID=UPI0008303A91|nr:hypothetical protein [Labilibacter marinus]
MNKLSIILTTAIFLFLGITHTKSQIKRYEVKSGKVIYTSSTNGKIMGTTTNGNGTEALYFKDWGITELKESKSTESTVTKMFGQKSEEKTSQHTLVKLDKGKSYTVDFDVEAIYVNKDLALEMMESSDANANASEIGEQMLISMGGQKIGTEKFLGYDCEVWSIAGGKQWIYHGVMLKAELTLMGITTSTVAQSAEFNISVSEDHFQLPNYPIKQSPTTAMGQGMFEDMGEMDDEEDWSAADMEKLSKMSYEEYKKMVKSSDPEAAKLSDEELKATYNMMQQMLKLKTGK